MSEYKTEATVDAGGDLHLHEVPFDPGERVEVIVTRASHHHAWPEGYFESTFGSIPDPTVIRHPLGDFEQRGLLP